MLKPLSLSLLVRSGKQDKGRFFGKKKAVAGTHTLLSTTPAAARKNNEYFNGESTVTLAGDEDDE